MLKSRESATPEAGRSALGRAQRGFVLAVVAGLLLSVGGLVGASWVKSPAEVQADQRAPAPDVLTAPVTRQVVSSTVVTRGTVTARRLTFTPTSEAGAGALVVSATPLAVGASIRPGDVVIEVSGRPLFALPGVVPAYRDLQVGDVGHDVARLQQALDSLGYRSADAPGTFGASTAAAVRRFYAARGYPVITSGSGKSVHVVVPMAELLYVPRFPSSLAARSGGVGTSVQAPLVTIRTGALGVTARFDAADRGAVRVGELVDIDDTVLGHSYRARISSVGDVVSPPSGQPYLPVAMRASSPLRADELGQDVEVTVVRARTAGAATVVPLTAVLSAPDGGTYVVIESASGQETRVPVAVGVTGGGFVQIVSGGVRAGERVVVSAPVS